MNMFLCFWSAETPLTLAAHLDNMVEIIVTLKNGGAHLDFRSRDGMTALHKAARAKNQIALKVINDPLLSCMFFVRTTAADLKQSSTVASYSVSDAAEFTVHLLL